MLVLLAIAVGAQAPPASAGYFVYSRDSAQGASFGDHDLWLVKDDGTGAKRLLDDPVADLLSPTVVPGSDRVGFEHRDSNSSNIASLEAGTTRMLSDAWASGPVFKNATDPEATVDGRILYSSLSGAVLGGCGWFGCGLTGIANGGARWASADGAHQGQVIVTGCSDAHNFAASLLDANTLAYSGNGCRVELSQGGPSPFDSVWGYEIRVTNGTQDQVIAIDDEQPSDMSWMPNGKYLVTSEGGDIPGLLFRFLNNTYTYVLKLPAGAREPFGTPRYAGNGRVAFVADGDIWTIPWSCKECTFPGDATRITRSGDVGALAWTSATTFRTGRSQPSSTDRDGDRVNNAEDLCPRTPGRGPGSEDGCPPPKILAMKPLSLHALLKGKWKFLTRLPRSGKFTIMLTITAREARRLGLRGKSTAIADGAFKLKADDWWVTPTIKRSYRNAVAHAKHLTATLNVSLFYQNTARLQVLYVETNRTLHFR